MYIGKRKISNLTEYNTWREKCIKYKSDAAYTAFSELEGLINKSQLAEQYFEKSESWISERIDMCKKEVTFTENEYHKLADALRDIAKRLQAHADEIDAAKMEKD